MREVGLIEPPKLYDGPFVERLTSGQRLRLILQRLGLRGLARAVRRVVK